MKPIGLRPPAPSLVSLTIGFALGVAMATEAVAQTGESKAKPTNFIVLFVDDMGYGDLGCFGHPTIRTPHLDRMAREGTRFTQFYSAAPVCTPSRAALLTGRLPIRSGMCSTRRRVLFPRSKGGLPASEITLAEILHDRGYATACIGKWHLGHRPEFLPAKNGFDRYFGLPYSNDMDRVKNGPKGRLAMAAPKSEYWNVPLMRDDKVIERPAQQETLTKRYTEEAVRFLEEQVAAGKPFFLYLPYTMVHVPLFASNAHRGKSARGLYGDAVEEIDSSVGTIMATLARLDVGGQTLVFFTSDNGPWLPFGDHGGSAGLLRGGKGSTWEGGMREPAIAWWPAGIRKPGATCRSLATTMDIFATCVDAAGGDVPTDRTIDGVSLLPLLRDEKAGTRAARHVRDVVYYYRGTELWAVRKGRWKAHFKTRDGYGRGKVKEHETPLLFDLMVDPSEKGNVAAGNLEVVAAMRKLVETHRATLKPVENQLQRR